MSRFSLQGRFIFLITLILAVCMAVTVFLTLQLKTWPLVLPLVILLTFLAVIAAVKSFFRPINEILQALRSGVASFKDHDYSISIKAGRNDELGQLVMVYNDLARELRDERFSLFQRELLLDTVIRSSAVAVFIVNEGGAIVYSNREAQELLQVRTPLEGENLHRLSETRSPELAAALAERSEGLFNLNDQPDPDVFHLTCRKFNLNARIHHLFLVKKLTREIARQEVDTWKKVIRVITHEMNNSLAPISSLMASAKKIATTSQQHNQLEEIFTTVGDRTGHLQLFIEQYAQFARLPRPRVQRVFWADFLDQLRRLAPFRLAEDLSSGTAEFDPVQMEQVLINLLKNAAESGSAKEDVYLRILQNPEELLMAIEDRGTGMDAEQMQLAMLPFYSTKRSGTGLGLPLCREIIEAHGGSLQLFNREGGGMIATCKLPLRPSPVQSGGDQL